MLSISCYSTAIWDFVNRKNRKKVLISDENLSIQIEYDDLFKVTDGKIVIDFDECFSTRVGEAPFEIKPNSVCGQYLQKYPIGNIQSLIDSANIKPAHGGSLYNHQKKYTPGTIVPHNEFLLMAFSKHSNSVN